ncbi:MAG: hypothetical protein AB7L92_07480 [Alphaproteobacteria bacterium]
MAENRNIFTAIKNQFYDEKKGGVQVGGIIGLIAGGLMANAIIPDGLFGGGLFRLVAGGAYAMMGAWLGNQATGAISKYLNKNDATAPARAPAAGSPAAEPERQNTQSMTPDAQEAARQEALEQHGVSGGQEASGTPSQPAPATSANKGTGQKKP